VTTQSLDCDQGDVELSSPSKYLQSQIRPATVETALISKPASLQEVPPGQLVRGFRLALTCHMPVLSVLFQFWLHLRALLIKRFNYFKRDMKGFMFLIAIPLIIVLAIVGVLTVHLLQHRVFDQISSEFLSSLMGIGDGNHGFRQFCAVDV
jgi:hypothetical protein